MADGPLAPFFTYRRRDSRRVDRTPDSVTLYRVALIRRLRSRLHDVATDRHCRAFADRVAARERTRTNRDFALSALDRAITFGLLLDSLWLLAGGPGVFVGNSQDTLVMALFLPLMWAHWRYLAVAPVLAIVAVPGIAAKGLLVLHLIYLSWWTLPVIIYYAFTLKISRWHERGEFIAPYVRWWAAYANSWIGTGPGSFEWLTATQGLGSRMWLHNDWLQIGFEFGLVGLVIFAIAYYHLARKSQDPGFFFLLAVAMAAYSPLQFWQVQYLVVRKIFYESRRTT